MSRKQDAMSDRNNRKINEGIINPIMNKPQVITLSTTGVDDFSIFQSNLKHE